MPQGNTDVSDIDIPTHAAYAGHATMKTTWATHRSNLLAARNALLAASGNLNPSGAVELQRLIEAIDRNAQIYR
jgi:hypothetical protein